MAPQILRELASLCAEVGNNLFVECEVVEVGVECAGGVQVTINVSELPLVDRFQFLGPGNVPVHLSFQITYSRTQQPRTQQPRIIFPQTNAPLSPFNWAGTVWDATATGSFSFRYDDGSYSAQGITDSTLPTHQLEQYGTMGHERNGFFAHLP